MKPTSMLLLSFRTLHRRLSFISLAFHTLSHSYLLARRRLGSRRCPRSYAPSFSPFHSSDLPLFALPYRLSIAPLVSLRPHWHRTRSLPPSTVTASHRYHRLSFCLASLSLPSWRRSQNNLTSVQVSFGSSPLSMKSQATGMWEIHGNNCSNPISSPRSSSGTRGYYAPRYAHRDESSWKGKRSRSAGVADTESGHGGSEVYRPHD